MQYQFKTGAQTSYYERLRYRIHESFSLERRRSLASRETQLATCLQEQPLFPTIVSRLCFKSDRARQGGKSVIAVEAEEEAKRNEAGVRSGVDRSGKYI